MNNKSIILLLGALIAPFWLFSQTIFNQNLYIENKYSINPAYAGSLNIIDTYIDYQDFSTTIFGSPKFIAFGMNSPIYKKMSLGVRINKQSEGLFSTLSGFGDYSYLLNINGQHTLRFGISLGFVSNQLDNSRIVAEDPAAIIDVASKNFIGFGFQSAAGIVYNWNQFECSISSPQLFESRKKLDPSFSALMLYNLQLKNHDFALKPSIYINYSGNSPTLFDINLQTYWKQLFWVGVGYRNSPGFIASAGVKLKNIKIAYAIELGADKYSRMFNQVHEISISYSFSKKKRIPSDSTILTNDHIVVTNKDSLNQFKNDSVQIISQKVNNKDSLVNNIATNNTNKYNLEIIEEGNGVYSIKSKTDQSDSSSNSVEISEKMLDSLINSYTILKETNKNKKQTSDSTMLEDAPYYTIRLFIHKANIYLLKNAEIVMDTRVEKSADGNFIYLFGLYKSKEEVLEANQKLKKFTDLSTQIIPLKIEN